MISQLHLAFMLLHNRLTMDLREEFPRESSERIFSAARREACWFYQWLGVNDFLRRICDSSLMSWLWPAPNVLRSDVGRFAARVDWKLPYEFVLAGYRFGHGMVRPSYRSNDAMPNRPIFHPRGAVHWMADWRGHRKLPVQWSVQWDRFFDFAGSDPQKACCISTSIASSLCELPEIAVADDRERRNIVNLAERTLRAGRDAGLPSGQDAARYLRTDVFPGIGLRPIDVVDAGQHDPLWCYILKEASELGGGRRLGPVGSWIVALTTSSVLKADESSFLHDPSWAPDLPPQGDAFELRDLIRYTGMPMTHKDWESYVAGNLPTWSFTEAL